MEPAPRSGIVKRLPHFTEFGECKMMSGISIPDDGVSAADAFENRADDFAALAEDAATREDCLRYRDLERQYRLRAEEERAREIWKLYSANNNDPRAAA